MCWKAHRLESVMDFDKIVVLEKGRVVEEGRHAALLARGGLYARLWQKQHGFRVSAAGDAAAVDAERLGHIPMLQNLPAAVRADVASLFATEQYGESETVFREGDFGDRFYILVRGRVGVYKSLGGGAEQELAVIEDGDAFGEIALLHDAPRTATVRTLTPCLMLSLRREQFAMLLKRAPGVRDDLSTLASDRLAKSAAFAQPAGAERPS